MKYGGEQIWRAWVFNAETHPTWRGLTRRAGAEDTKRVGLDKEMIIPLRFFSAFSATPRFLLMIRTSGAILTYESQDEW